MSLKRTAGALDPWFCPNCRQTNRNEEQVLCPNCGDRLVPQGFCPVCERYLLLTADDLCPKHDIPLEEAPETPEAPVADDRTINWVTVKEFPNSLAAAIPRSRLEAEGIRTFVAGERMGALATYDLAIGGVKLQVPAEQASEARIILSQNWSLPADEGADFEDLV